MDLYKSLPFPLPGDFTLLLSLARVMAVTKNEFVICYSAYHFLIFGFMYDVTIYIAYMYVI